MKPQVQSLETPYRTRKQRYRDRLKSAGWVQFNVWVPKDKLQDMHRAARLAKAGSLPVG